MGSFSLSGGVEVFGFISPSNTMDQYPVIDPLYGIDGLRNVDNLSDLDLIPNLRRRAGMLVGVSGGTVYYKLKNVPWNNTFSDWELFELGSNFTGGTVSGATIFTNGVTANTFSAATYLGLPSDIYVTGFTYLDNTLTIERSSGNPNLFVTINDFTGLTINGDLNVTGNTIVDGITANTISASTYLNLPIDVFVTGGTYSSGITTFTNNTGGTFDVSGFVTGDTFVTGLTFNNSNYDLTIIRNDGVSFTDSLSILASDLTITGGTYNPSTGTATFTNNSGGTFDVTGFLTGFTDIHVTGGTYSAGTATFTNTSGTTFDVTGFSKYFVATTEPTGTTINLGDRWFNLTDGVELVYIDTGSGFQWIEPNPGGEFVFPYLALSGGTVSGATTFTNGLFANSISATTYLNLPTDVFVTGGTYSEGTTTFTNNTGGTFSVSGFSEPFTGGSGSCITELYIEDLFSCNTGITLNNDIIPNVDNTINLGTPITRFREINTVSGTSTIWSATTRIYTPEVDLGLDGLGNSRIINANNSIIQNDILVGGTY